MENKDSSRQDRLFHFTLDLPDKPSPHTSDKRDENIFQNTVRSKKRRPDSQPQERQDTVSRTVKARPQAAESKTQARQAAESKVRTRQASADTIRRPVKKRRKKIAFSDIQHQEGFGEKLKFLFLFLGFYLNAFSLGFKRELTPEKMLAKEKRPAVPKATSAFSTLIFFPAAIFYMELVFHIYMKLGIKYIPIYLFFSIAGGLVCVLLTSFFPETVNRIIGCVLTGFLGFIFCVEIICKTVLAQYYQIASSLSMAMNNKLGDYTGAIFKGIFMNIFGLLLMFVPLILLLTVLRKRIKFGQKPCGLICTDTAWYCFLPFIWVNCPKTSLWRRLKILPSFTTPIQKLRNRFDSSVLLRCFALILNILCLVSAVTYLSTMPILTNWAAFKKALKPAGESDESSNESEAAVIDTSPNVLDLDFDGLSASNGNESVKWLNEYFSSLTPTNKNKYTGMFKGYNVIFITAEGFSGYMIDKELTPTLYKLTHEGFVFNNFYTPLHYTSTSNGECQNLLGLYPKNGEPRTMGVVGTYPLSMPFTLCSQLTNLGYNSIGYHFNGDVYERRQSHTALGYEWNDSSQLELEKNQYGNNIWPQSDEYMITETFDLYVNRQPFNIYYLTISGHMPYTDGGNSMAVRNAELVKDLPYSQATKDYVAANLELEKGLTTLVSKLESAGIADKTLIVMAPDHIPYFDLPVLEELTGQKFGDSEDTKRLNEENLNFDVYKNSLIIWSASMTEPIVVDKVCGQVDVLPTVSNLLGLNYDSRLIEGQDILSDSEGLVIFCSRSWKSDKGFYNSYTGEIYPGQPA